MINDAIPCECDALARAEEMRKLVTVKPKDYLGNNFTETLMNLNKIYREIQNKGQRIRLVLTPDVLTPGCDPMQMYSYNTGSRSAINRAHEVVIEYNEETFVVKKRHLN